MDSENPMALILSGQTELWDKLRLSAYRAILERVDIECFLTPMDFADTKQYIETLLLYSGHDYRENVLGTKNRFCTFSRMISLVLSRYIFQFLYLCSKGTEHGAFFSAHTG